MSRAGRKVVTEEVVEFDLESKVEDYGLQNRIKLDATKVVKGLVDEIKNHFISNNLSAFSSENYTAKLTKKTSESMDLELAIDVLKKLKAEKKLTAKQLNSCVVKVEQIDEDALEKLIYDGVVTASDLACTMVEKEPTYSLSVTKKKGA